MSGNRKVNMKDMPVDKLDLFFRQNYKTILGALFIVVALFVLGYGIYNMVENNRKNRMESIAVAEIAGLSTKAQIETYQKIADYNEFAKDYINMTAAEHWMAIGYNENAKAALAKVGGHFLEYAKSLDYDLGNKPAIDPQLMSSGMFAPLWYYRAILAAPEGSRGALIAQFRAEWPDSQLLAQLYKWDIK
ncbi:MAG: hypothetical protein LBH05_01155 [Deferribacteraceae bacterium]|jgi:hypothetical protein|nr:hypothetical protein [Deferribacteraceae bacterium]